MSRLILMTLVLSFCLPLHSSTERSGTSNGFLNRAARNKGKTYDRQALTRAIDETLVNVEDLARRLKSASPAEIEEVWASGTRDFRLEASEVREGRKACESMLKALEHLSKATEFDKEKSESYKNDARDQIRSHHRKQSEEYVQNFRNWLIINEGTLRKAQEKQEVKK